MSDHKGTWIVGLIAQDAEPNNQTRRSCVTSLDARLFLLPCLFPPLHLLRLLWPMSRYALVGAEGVPGRIVRQKETKVFRKDRP